MTRCMQCCLLSLFAVCLRVDDRGVELGKVLAKRILAEYGRPDDVKKNHDGSTAGLILHYLSKKQ
jgi:glucose-6-phosphate isomerase